MNLQNNESSTTQEKDLSLGVKIVLLIGGLFASETLTCFVAAGTYDVLPLRVILGLVFLAGSLGLSYLPKPEIRYAFVVPLYLCGMELSIWGISECCGFVIPLVSFLSSLIALPILVLSGSSLLRHLALAQFLWLTPLWFPYEDARVFGILTSSQGAVYNYLTFLSVCAILLYLLTILFEKEVQSWPKVAAEWGALRLILILLVIGITVFLNVWVEYASHRFSPDAVIPHGYLLHLIIAFLMLPLTFRASDRAGLALSILFLIYSLTHFYYAMEVDLLAKSAILMGHGILFLGICYFLKSYITCRK